MLIVANYYRIVQLLILFLLIYIFISFFSFLIATITGKLMIIEENTVGTR